MTNFDPKKVAELQGIDALVIAYVQAHDDAPGMHHRYEQLAAPGAPPRTPRPERYPGVREGLEAVLEIIAPETRAFQAEERVAELEGKPLVPIPLPAGEDDPVKCDRCGRLASPEEHPDFPGWVVGSEALCPTCALSEGVGSGAGASKKDGAQAFGAAGEVSTPSAAPSVQDRWVNAVITGQIPLDVDPDASDQEKLEAAVKAAEDHHVYVPDGYEVTHETVDPAPPPQAVQGEEGDETGDCCEAEKGRWEQHAKDCPLGPRCAGIGSIFLKPTPDMRSDEGRGYPCPGCIDCQPEKGGEG